MKNNMDLLNITKEICKKNNIVPTRSKGQNFLVKESVYDDIIEKADITKEDTILEVGPGLGFLTEKLSEKAKKVIAVELDDKLAVLLKKKIEKLGLENVEIINKDILKIKDDDLDIGEYKIVANLPYNITSIFLRRFLENNNIRPKSITLMLQKEVAERIIAKTGKMSLLAVSVRFYADVEILKYVGRNDFWPSPEVDSAVIKFIPFLSDSSKGYELGFFQMVKFGFSARRKMLKNNLAGGYCLDNKEAEEIVVRSGQKATVRAQELSIEDWKNLYKEVIRVVDK